MKSKQPCSNRTIIFIRRINVSIKNKASTIMINAKITIILGCQTAGVYGESCEQRCPINCRDNTCHIQKGTCFECSPGWRGTTCYTGNVEVRIYSYVTFGVSPILYSLRCFKQTIQNK